MPKPEGLGVSETLKRSFFDLESRGSFLDPNGYENSQPLSLVPLGTRKPSGRICFRWPISLNYLKLGYSRKALQNLGSEKKQFSSTWIEQNL